ncbi:MAG: ATPase, T2SS/T4P/T4SS family [Thermodesulfobacteriota bacterium]
MTPNEAPARHQYLKTDQEISAELRDIADRVFGATNLNEILIDLKDDIMSLFNAERLTIYMVDGVKKELVSFFMSAGEVDEIRVPISGHSIVGFAVANRKLINISDVYDEMELSAIDPELKFDSTWDKKMAFRTKEVMAAPIIFKRFLLGAIQLVNHKAGTPFVDTDQEKIQGLVEVLGNAFYFHKAMAAKGKTNRFEHLIVNHFISQKDVKQAADTARSKKVAVEDVLMRDFGISKSDICTALSKYYGIDFIEFSENFRKPLDLLTHLKQDYLRRDVWVPLRKDDDDAVLIAIDNPHNLMKTDQIERIFKGRQIKYVVALKQDILNFIDLFTRVEKASADAAGNKAQARGQADESERFGAETSSIVVRMINRLILDACERGASDIHIEPFADNRDAKVRIRIDGACSVYQTIPAVHRDAVVSRIKIMANLDIAERRKPQDGKIAFKKFGGKDVELRVATMPTQGGLEDVVLRILAAGEPLPLDKIGFSEANYANFLKVVNQPYGIIFVCGPTGSGKTTTLHSALGYINTDERKIWTAEDPVEITQEGLRQVQVKPKIGFTFAQAMRSFLRLDPDVIMVGEMRDEETTSIGIEASLTGHLVLSTLHTNTAPESITRLLDMGMDPFNFADAVLAIMAQRLVRTLCGKCKREYHPSEAEFDELVREYGAEAFEKKVGLAYTKDLALFKPVGCDTCNHTGYRGRMGLHELLMGTDGMKRLIQQKAEMEQIRNQAIADGMTTLKQDGIEKIFAGHCDLQQVRKVCIK